MPSSSLGLAGNLLTEQVYFLSTGETYFAAPKAEAHLALLAKGSVCVTLDGQRTEFTAPHMIAMPAQKASELQSLVAATVVYFVHVLKSGADIVPPEAVPSGAELRKLVEAARRVQA